MQGPEPVPSLSRSQWRQYIQLTSGEPPWPQLVRAAEMFEQPGEALDVGAGAGRDTGYLLRKAWRVTAVDASPHAAAALRRMPRQRNLQVVESAIEEFRPTAYDLINAQFSLPFISHAHFTATVRRLRDSLRPDGLMAATFFGKRDEWNVTGTELSFSTPAEIKRMLTGLEFIELTENEEDGHTADGAPKHWHLFHVIAGRRAV